MMSSNTNLIFQIPLEELGACCATKRAFYIQLKDGTVYERTKRLCPVFGWDKDNDQLIVKAFKIKTFYSRQWITITPTSIAIFDEVEYKIQKNKKPWLKKKTSPKPVVPLELAKKLKEINK